MVKKWEKNLRMVEKGADIDFDTIFDDLYSDNVWQYDVKRLVWYKNLFRIRIWDYRIIFEKTKEKNIVRDFWRRQSIYKKI